MSLLDKIRNVRHGNPSTVSAVLETYLNGIKRTRPGKDASRNQVGEVMRQRVLELQNAILRHLAIPGLALMIGMAGAVAQSGINTWEAAGKSAPPRLSAETARYTAQQDSIARKATELEHQRDEKSREAEVLLSQHHIYAAAVALLQISIALGAIAALTGSRLVWFGSVGLGVVAAILLAIPMIRGS